MSSRSMIYKSIQNQVRQRGKYFCEYYDASKQQTNNLVIGSFKSQEKCNLKLGSAVL
ncbi:hypothetical protein H6G76_30310 [Nostoc sp. FACHB-152]|uniref:hypothetical protein n=1 Tax=Nostoc sp. FACHB-152 TaxID=2692837 RepID=UPI001685100A|nr:hypothetical protein [Nostoc sp. FACHB-152]MBD2451345.1 hypothetical protein [Nostoc sp. FACHB-152]